MVTGTSAAPVESVASEPRSSVWLWAPSEAMEMPVAEEPVLWVAVLPSGIQAPLGPPDPLSHSMMVWVCPGSVTAWVWAPSVEVVAPDPLMVWLWAGTSVMFRSDSIHEASRYFV